MLKKYLLALPILLLTACDGPNIGPDNYTFTKPEFERNDVTITIVTYNTRQELHQAAKELVGIEDPSLMAFTTYSSNIEDNMCTMHIMNPVAKYEPEWIGHETAHCFYGQWHTSNDDRE